MRPVNLIPSDERRGGRTPLRTGHFTYVLVGGLALLLLGIVVVALTSKQISDRKSEQQQLERELADATARAQSLQAFADFRALQETRASTVSSLAQTRFDWERVMNELALILPEDIWLSSLTGTVSPAVIVEGAESVDERASVNGPALEIIGCATGQDAVAGFVASLEDIDGVTRVGLSSSELPGEEESASGGSSGSGGQEDCQTRPDIVKFQIVVAFDAVPVPPTATAAPSVPAPVAPPTGGDQSQVAPGQSQQAAQTASASAQTAKAQQATSNLIPGN